MFVNPGAGEADRERNHEREVLIARGGLPDPAPLPCVAGKLHLRPFD